MARISLLQMMLLVAAAAVGCWLYSRLQPCKEGCKHPPISVIRTLGYYHHVGYTAEVKLICPHCGMVQMKTLTHRSEPISRRPGMAFSEGTWRDRLLWELSPDCPLRVINLVPSR